MNKATVPIALVYIECTDMPVFDGIFLSLVVANEKNFIAEAKISPFTNFDSLQLKQNIFGIDLVKVNPSGPKGRIIKEDLHHFVRQMLNESSAGSNARRWNP